MLPQDIGRQLSKRQLHLSILLSQAVLEDHARLRPSDTACDELFAGTGAYLYQGCPLVCIGDLLLSSCWSSAHAPGGFAQIGARNMESRSAPFAWEISGSL